MTQPIHQATTNLQEDRRSSLRSLKILILLAICQALIWTGYGIIIPVFPQRLQALGLGVETLALMEMAFGLGIILFSTPLGILADRFGRKPVVLLALAGFIGTNILLVLISHPASFILIRFVEGACIAGLSPAALAVVGDILPEQRRGRWLGVMLAAQATGAALGPGMGGILYEAWGFITPFLLSAGIAACASLLALVILPETLSQSVREQARQQRAALQQSGKRSSWLAVLPRPLGFFGILLLIDLLLSFTYPFVLPLYPFFFGQELGYTALQYGLIISVYGIAVSVFPLLTGRLIEGSSRTLFIALGCFLTIGLNVGMIFLQNYVLLLLVAVITGLGQSLYLPGLGIFYLNATNEQNRSQIMGLRGTALALGITLGPLSQALLSFWITPVTSFTVGAIIPLGGCVLVLLALRSHTKKGEWEKKEEVVNLQEDK